MLVALWLATGTLATLMTLLWGWVSPERGTYVSASVATLAWGICALTAGNVEVVTQDGSVVTVGSTPLQLLCLGLALISALALISYYAGHYPPSDDDEQLHSVEPPEDSDRPPAATEAD